MSLYAIGDLHLSLSNDKPMDVFGPSWEGHVERLRDGFSHLTDEDVTVLCGDLSWAMSLREAGEDFRFIDSLPGMKYIIKGNHDYWFSTAAKIHSFFDECGIKTIKLIHNNCAFYGETALCGTRGWFYDQSKSGAHDEKIFRRELMRLETSLKAAGDAPKLCFLHYPPVFDGFRCGEITDMLENYGVTKCCYGHLHGRSIFSAVRGLIGRVEYSLVSADALGFRPVKLI